MSYRTIEHATSHAHNGRDFGKECSVKRTQVRRARVPLAALLAAGLAVTFLPVELAAQGLARGGAEVASAAVFAGGVDLAPAVRYREAVVTVSGNGVTFRQVFKPGERLSIGVFDPEGYVLADGVYSWELQLVPDARTAEKLRASAARNGGIAPEAWRPATGTFAIAGGAVLAPDLAEPRPARRAAAPGAAMPAADFIAASGAREAAGDDDAAVGRSKNLEAGLKAALRRQPQAPAAAGGPPAARQELLERSDAAAQAMGRSLERRPAPQLAPEAAQAAPRSIFDNAENGFNGRPTSEDNR